MIYNKPIEKFNLSLWMGDIKFICITQVYVCIEMGAPVYELIKLRYYTYAFGIIAKMNKFHIFSFDAV